MIKHKPELSGKLTAHDFPSWGVQIKFEVDEGYCQFKNAFVLREGERGEFTVVYTEHLGYHVFYTETIVLVKCYDPIGSPMPTFLQGEEG